MLAFPVFFQRYQYEYTPVFQKTVTLDRLNIICGEIRFKKQWQGEYTEILFQIFWVMLYVAKNFL